jgi:hypothetical protein
MPLAAKEELSRRLIRPDEILGQTYGSWKVKGNVTNRSAYELSGFTLKIKVQDCPTSLSPTSSTWDRFPLVQQTMEPAVSSDVSSDRCTTVGENEVSTYLSVPPNQMRAFDHYVSLYDMPQPKKLGWTYTIQEVRGKVK